MNCFCLYIAQQALYRIVLENQQFPFKSYRFLLQAIVYQVFSETLENLYIYQIALDFILDKLKI